MSNSSVGSHRLAEQIGGWAVFADITVSVIHRTVPGPFVTLGPGIEMDPWGRDLAAISFGAASALECVNGEQSAAIVVHKLHTNPVDTTPMALAFATCHALLKCFNVPATNGPTFDRLTRSFVFPSRTSRST